MKSKNYYKFFIFIFIALNFILLQFPIAHLVLYPFVIISTWFHEIGHGLAAIILNGDLLRIELYADGSGVAVHTPPQFLGNVGNAVVAISGPLFPPIVGFTLFKISKNRNLIRLSLLLLSLTILGSVVVWIRTLFGVIILLLISLIIMLVALSKNSKIQFITLQLIGIQAFISVYLSLGYLFSRSGTVNQSSFSSDTSVIEQNTFLPYWFWASAILIISAVLFVISIKNSIKNFKQLHQ
jgi:hypothetical protein